MSGYTAGSDQNEWPKSKLCCHYTLEHETLVAYLHRAGRSDADIGRLLLRNFPNVIEVEPEGDPQAVPQAVAGWVALRNSRWCPEVHTDKDTLLRYSWGPAAFKRFGPVSAPEPYHGPMRPIGSGWGAAPPAEPGWSAPLPGEQSWDPAPSAESGWGAAPPAEPGWGAPLSGEQSWNSAPSAESSWGLPPSTESGWGLPPSAESGWGRTKSSGETRW